MSLDTKNKSLCAIYWQQINLELLEIIDFSIQTLMGMLLSLSSWAVGRVMSCPEILVIQYDDDRTCPLSPYTLVPCLFSFFS